MTRKKEGLDIFLMFREDPNSHWRVTGEEGKADWEHQNGMMCWTVDWSCGCLWPIACACQRDCVCVRARLWLSVGLFWGFFGILPCVFVLEKENQRLWWLQRCTQGRVWLHMFSWPKVFIRLSSDALERKCCCGQCWPVTDRRSAHHPSSTTLILAMCGCLLTALYDLVCLSAEAFSSTRLDWSQLLTSALLTSETKHC